MSLVQSIIYKDFCVICGDQKASLSNGTIRHDFRKIFKLNNKVVIGITGDIQDNYLLFQDFLTPDFNLQEGSENVEFQSVYEKVALRFDVLERDMIQHETFSVVCGWNGTGFEGRTFFMGGKSADNLGITQICPETSDSARLITCGDPRHHESFFKFKENYPFNILGVKNTFRDVLEAGVQFDDTINTNAMFEVLKRSKVNQQ